MTEFLTAFSLIMHPLTVFVTLQVWNGRSTGSTPFIRPYGRPAGGASPSDPVADT
ncbi:hypothetical protein [Sinorhizobium prairiense]|uniref:hypothetical protein n=1 Tax=unclassified Sinorhizobium TaxID=2613772 RepID=UPI0023D7E823|nr:MULTISPECIES: hypothetical protein [unclassified Sinorhizobium]WEJ08630.1 hypothetical protein N0Q90_00475 [Sinorhizobium sp. M103]WEJ13869.1 hypothetical protein N0Q91_02200 [Sinorhizobium sp. K101]WEJ35466.1 hypothetical protein N0R80_02220 [Sinorhizobium sp. C101]